MSDADHYEAVEALLRADSRLTVVDTVLDDGGAVREGTYVVLAMALRELTSNRYTARQRVDSDATYDIALRIVATTANGVRRTSDVVRPLLLGQKPTVQGRDCAPIVFDGADEPTRAKDVAPILFFADEDYILTSRKATS
ncbi:hypothetical protein [Herbiconiux solani]|uniref:hypothetical protein n=1 Tax=Herbiconiux solani TaxID=661329 RepID=UPI00082422CF|nr:hypothetical protein [Herbiconiux solani]